MATIKQIAEMCNVSVATVSKALNNATDVGAETAARVREAAKSVGYFPNSAARALKTNRSHNLGVLFKDATQSGLTHEFFSLILNSFKCEAERCGYDNTFLSQNIGLSKMSYLEHCRYRNCDGAVVASGEFTDPAIVELANSSIPVVTIDYIFDNCGAVLSDNAQSMEALVRHVYLKGHRKIAFIHGEDTAVTRTRLATFYRALSELNVEVPDDYVLSAYYHDPRSSGLATRRILELKNRPTCIFYPDDFSYMGGMSEIEKHGLSIPDDISVVGYDGIILSRVLRPRLTTLIQDTDRIGVEAARLLVEAIERPKTYLPKRIVIPGRVQEGETVKNISRIG